MPQERDLVRLRGLARQLVRGAYQGRLSLLSLKAMALSPSRTRSPKRRISPDWVGLYREQVDTLYPYGLHAGPPGEPVWQIADGRLRSPRYGETCSWDGPASESVTFLPFQQIILTRTVHGVG